jgi:RNA polymerase sigma-70 factor (ECF subfamily)
VECHGRFETGGEVALHDSAQRDLLSESLGRLLTEYQQGNRDAANEFVRLLHPVLYRYFLVQTGNPAQSEDLMQECWMRIHRGRSSYRPGEPVLPWAFAIARHTKIDEYRKDTARARREAAVAGPTEPAVDPRRAFERSLEASAILSRLHELPDGQREVFIMLKVQGMSVDEVADVIGSSRSAVKQKAYRAYETLRKWIAQPLAGTAGGGVL